MRKLFFTLTFLILLTSFGFAQEKSSNYKLGAFYSFNQFPGFKVSELGEYVDGYHFEFRGRVTGKSTKLWGLAVVERKNDITQFDPETYPIILNSSMAHPMFSVVQRNTTSLRFGTALSHSFGAFEPFASLSVGFRASNDVQPRKLEQAGQFGGDVNLNKFFIRIGYQLTRVTGNNGIEEGYFVGGGFRF